MKARELIQEGAIGKLVTIRTHRVGYLNGIWMRDGWRQNADIAGGWDAARPGLPLHQHRSHAAGDISSVAAFVANTRSDWVGDDTATLIFRFKSGLIGGAVLLGNPNHGRGKPSATSMASAATCASTPGCPVWFSIARTCRTASRSSSIDRTT